jgi:hypothetical protein
MTSLRHLKPGDFFFAVADFGSHATCLMTGFGDDIVHARVITMQFALKFDPDTGIGNTVEGDYPCRVTSVEQPSDGTRDILLGLDCRYRQGVPPALSKTSFALSSRWTLGFRQAGSDPVKAAHDLIPHR